MIAPGEDFGGRALDSSNQLAVIVVRDQVTFRSAPWNQKAKANVLDTDQALNLAAWIVCLIDPKREKFDRLVAEIQK